MTNWPIDSNSLCSELHFLLYNLRTPQKYRVSTYSCSFRFDVSEEASLIVWQRILKHHVKVDSNVLLKHLYSFVKREYLCTNWFCAYAPENIGTGNRFFYYGKKECAKKSSKVLQFNLDMMSISFWCKKWVRRNAAGIFYAAQQYVQKEMAILYAQIMIKM